MAFQVFDFGKRLGLVGSMVSRQFQELPGTLSQIDKLGSQRSDMLHNLEKEFEQPSADKLRAYREPPIYGDSVEVIFEGADPEAAQNLHEITQARMREDGSIEVVIRNALNGERLFDVKYLPAQGGSGWMPVIDNPDLLPDNSNNLVIPRSMPLLGFAFAGWSGFMALRITKNKIEHFLSQALTDFVPDDTSGRNPEIAHNAYSLFKGQNFINDIYQSVSVPTRKNSEKGASVLSDEGRCCIPHDMTCTGVPDVLVYGIPLPWCKMIEVDITSCCREHDIKLWCGIDLNRNTEIELLTGKVHRFALEASLELGACVLGKFLNSITKNS